MWLIIGLILGAGLLALVLLLRTRKIAVKWYEWLIGAIGLILLLFTIQNFTGSLAEHEEFAAPAPIRSPAVNFLKACLLLMFTSKT